MYNLPQMRQANSALWAAIRDRLRDAGVEDVPEALDFERPAVPDAIGPEVLFTQTCGYPLLGRYRGQYRLLGIPEYDAPGCGAPEIAGPSHRAVFLVRHDDRARTLADLRGRAFACNSLHSNSGMNLPRRSLAAIAGGRPFFAAVVMTGTHPNSMRAVQEGAADACSVDNVTYALHGDCAPQMVEGLRVLADTVPSPAIPFVTSAATDDRTVAALRGALWEISGDDRSSEIRRPVRLRAIHPPDTVDFAIVARYEAEAAMLGYSALA